MGTNPLHPRVKAAAKVSTVIAAVFTVLSALGVIIPGDLQNAVATLAVDVALAVPVAAAWLKKL